MTRHHGEKKYLSPATESPYDKNNYLRYNYKLLMDFLKDLWFFMKERKKFWLLPVLLVLLLLGVLIVIGGSSALAPFIYSLF